jgi:hypothetical protein
MCFAAAVRGRDCVEVGRQCSDRSLRGPVLEAPEVTLSLSVRWIARGLTQEDHCLLKGPWAG